MLYYTVVQERISNPVNDLRKICLKKRIKVFPGQSILREPIFLKKYDSIEISGFTESSITTLSKEETMFTKLCYKNFFSEKQE